MTTLAIDIHGTMVKFDAPTPSAKARMESFWTKEPATLQWIDGFAEGAVLWDVGANIGLYSIYAAVTRKCRVLAFEPVPASYASLCRTIMLNGLGDLVWPFPIGLGNQRRTAPTVFGMERGDAGSTGGQLGGHGLPELTILGSSIDALSEDLHLPLPDHLKIDIDGNELAVLQGAERTLGAVASLSVEVDHRQDARTMAVRRFVEEAGLTITDRHMIAGRLSPIHNWYCEREAA